MRTIQASELAERLASELNKRMDLDLFYSWIEECLGRVYTRRFGDWDSVESKFLFKEPIAETTAKFSWTRGSNVITGDVAPTDVDWTHTGRYVYLNERWYKCIDMMLKNPTTGIVVDGYLEEDGTDQELKFYAPEFCISSQLIYSMECHRGHLLGVEEAQRISDFESFTQYSSVGEPSRYYKAKNSIPTPKFPPLVTGVTVGTFTGGEYIYAFSRRNRESGEESPLGPSIRYQATAGQQPNIVYGSTSGASEDTSYELVLYRSEVNPTRLNCPMFAIQDRTPFTASAYIDQTPGQLYSYRRYMPKNTVLLTYPFPDDKYAVTIRHGYNVPHRIHELDQIALGPRLEVIDLLKMYILWQTSNGSSQDSLTAKVAFDKVLAFAITSSMDPVKAGSTETNWRPLDPAGMHPYKHVGDIFYSYPAGYGKSK